MSDIGLGPFDQIVPVSAEHITVSAALPQIVISAAPKQEGTA